MDYTDILDNISRQNRIINATLDQTQRIFKDISPALWNSLSSVYPVASTFSKTYSLIDDTIRNIAEQFSPVVSTVQRVIKQLNLPSLYSQLRDISNVSKCLLEAKELNIGNDIFCDTIFDTGTTDVDESVCEKIITDSVIVSEKIVQKSSKKPIHKKCAIRKVIKALSNIFTAAILPAIFFIFAPIWQSIYDEHIQPKIYYNEFLELQEQNQELNLRIVVKDTALYLGKHMKMVTAFVEKYDIVEVLEDCGKVLKVRIFDSDEVGWIYKKYTKSSKKL